MKEDNQQEDVENKISEDTEIQITETEQIQISDVSSQQGNDQAPILQQLNEPVHQGMEADNQEDEAIFEEIPEELCGQLYSSALEIAHTLKNKTGTCRSLPESRIKTQGSIIYEILKKNQISIKHIDIFMLGAGMIADWKYMGTKEEEE